MGGDGGSEWFDPLEDAVRQRIRGFIEALVESELEVALGGRSRYGRQGRALLGYRHGHRQPGLLRDPDGTVVKVRLDRQATNICLLVVMGVRRDGQKVLLAVRNMGGESEAAWRVLDDLMAHGRKTPELVIMDGGKGLEAALAGVWNEVPVQRCTVHKERNLVAQAPKRMAEELKKDFKDGLR